MTHEGFKAICLREYPKIEGMVKTVKALGVDYVTCSVYADGHINFDVHEKKDKSFFEQAIQEYCYNLFAIGTTASKDAFMTLSVKLNKIFPSNLDFLNNIGSYHLVNSDFKDAFKKMYGVSPRAYRDSHTTDSIHEETLSRVGSIR